jgi:3-dehydro-4-phosphotetronate decarboxylase
LPLEELEETARLWVLHRANVTPLSPERIDELKQRFGASW